LKDFFNSVRFRIILGIVVLLVGMGVYTVATDGEAFVVSQGVYRLFEPVLKATSSVVDSVTTKVDAILNSKQYYEENQALKQEIYDLNEKLVDYEENKQELEELKKFVNIKEDNPNYDLSAPCSIISKSSSDPYCSFIIDKGSEDGIELYDPVVTGSGLVGIISEVAETYSTVTTILSPNISVGAVDAMSNDTGVVQGNASQSVDGLTRLIYLDKENTLKVGDTITCSGSSGTFPKGFLIGTVTEVGVEETGLSAYAIVQPFVDIDKLTSVIVIMDFNGQGVGGD
jgi:rod shape-determining protein MreC